MTEPLAAAFFDLDKTILAKSSTLAFTRKFYEGGLIRRPDAVKAAYAQFVYLLSGADHDQHYWSVGLHKSTRQLVE